MRELRRFIIKRRKKYAKFKSYLQILENLIIKTTKHLNNNKDNLIINEY